MAAIGFRVKMNEKHCKQKISNWKRRWVSAWGRHNQRRLLRPTAQLNQTENERSPPVGAGDKLKRPTNRSKVDSYANRGIIDHFLFWQRLSICSASFIRPHTFSKHEGYHLCRCHSFLVQFRRLICIRADLYRQLFGIFLNEISKCKLSHQIRTFDSIFS